MVEITREELRILEKTLKIDISKFPEREKVRYEFKCPEDNIMLDVCIMGRGRSGDLTNDIILRIRDNEISFIEKISDAIEVSSRSAKLAYYCMVYKILEVNQYHYKTDKGSRMITLRYFCREDIFNLRYATIYERMHNEKFAYCNIDLEHFDIDNYYVGSDSRDVKHCMKQLKSVYKEIKNIIQY